MDVAQIPLLHSPLQSFDFRTPSFIPEGAWLCPKNDPYPVGAPLITSVPDDDSPMAYNEDEMVYLWNEIYHVCLQNGVFKDEDVVFPPEDTGRHPDFNRDLYRNQFNMSDRVISLLERLPYPAKGVEPGDGIKIFTEGLLINYLHGDQKDFRIETCREPHTYLTKEYIDFSTWPSDLSVDMVPDDVNFLSPYESEGTTWIFDTRMNAIRTIDGLAELYTNHLPVQYQPERRDAETYYRNWPAYHAPFVLKRFIQDLWDLKFVPSGPGAEGLMGIYDVRSALIANEMREYGWPDNFRKEDWYRDLKKITRAAWDVSDGMAKLHSEQELVLERWEAHPERIPRVGIEHLDWMDAE